MKVLIVGANGKIGRRLVRLMAQGEHDALAMIRDPDQARYLQDLGADTVIADLEKDCSHALTGCDAVIFTAGSGPHTGADKTVAVDQNGAIDLMDKARAAGVMRFIIVSSMRADEPDSGPQKIQHYLRAKKKADEHLRASGLDYGIVRPGRLTDDPGSGRVNAAARLQESGEIPREDVAAALLATLDATNTVGLTFDLLTGEKPIEQALAELA